MLKKTFIVLALTVAPLMKPPHCWSVPVSLYETEGIAARVAAVSDKSNGDPHDREFDVAIGEIDGDSIAKGAIPQLAEISQTHSLLQSAHLEMVRTGLTGAPMQRHFQTAR